MLTIFRWTNDIILLYNDFNFVGPKCEEAWKACFVGPKCEEA